MWEEKYFSRWSKLSSVLAVKLAEMCTSRSWVGSRDWFSIALGPLRVSGFMWHSSKWAHQSALGILQYMSGFEVLACSFDTDFNYYNFISAKCFFYSYCNLVLHCFLYSQWLKNRQIRGSLTEPNLKIFLGFFPLAPTRPQTPDPQLHWAHLWPLL